MKKTYTLILLVALNSFVFGQGKLVIDQPFVELPAYRTQTKEIDALSQLPPKIQFITKSILDSAMTGFSDEIRFAKGQILNLDILFEDDSISQAENKFIVPEYQLFFELSDPTLGIKSFCFEMSFDHYGQVTFFGWPRTDYNKRESFIKPQLIMAEAERYAREKNYKTDTSLCELKYDTELDRVCWYISFLQKTTGDNYNYEKEYNTIVVDATSLTVLKELGMTNVGTTNE